MTLRRHKYKQRLADLEDYLKKAYGKAVEDLDAATD